MAAWTRNKLQKEEDNKKKQEKEAAVNVSSSLPGRDVFEAGTSSSYSSPITPSSAFHIRNRLLSKMGAPVCMQCV